MLGRAIAYAKAQLRADFQQYYNLDIDALGDGLAFVRAADLCAQLPGESRVMRLFCPEREWDVRLWFLSSIDYSLRYRRWLDEMRLGVNSVPPEMVMPYPKKQKAKEKPKEARTSGQLMEILGRRRHG